MTWTSMIAMAGGVLALGPIIIHIIFRFRYRVIEFAAMRFLLESLRRNRQRLRLEELLIILLRIAACVLIGWMLADVRAKSLVPGAAAPTAHVFVLDDSLSMGQIAGTGTLFQKAVDYLAEQIRSLPEGDMVAILSASRPEAGEPVGSLVLVRDLQQEEFLRRLTALRPTDLRAKLPESLATAQELLAAQNDLAGRVYLVSDFRRLDFVESQGADALRRSFKSLADTKAELVLLDFGLPCENNLTVEKVAAQQKLVVSGVNTPIEVVVRNGGTQTVENAHVTIETGSVALPAVPLLAIAPGEVATATFDYVFPESGYDAVKVAVPGDALPADSQTDFAVSVREAMQVLVIDGSPEPASFNSGSFCLANALDPSGEGAFSQRVAVVSADAMPEENLERYDAIFLTNVRSFPAVLDEDGKPVYPRLKALERYVREGGGLGVFLGDAIDVDFYNGPMYAEGSGLCPLSLDEAPVPAADPERFVRLRPDSIGADRMLRIFTGRSEKLARLVRFYVHVPVQASAVEVFADTVGPPQVLATFDDPQGSPAVVKRRYGDGRVIFWYTAADVSWTDWPRNLSFLPVVNDMAWQLARSGSQGLHARVGDDIVFAPPPQLIDATSIALKVPAYPVEDLHFLKLDDNGPEKVVRYPAATQAGRYEMEFLLPDRTQQTVLFSRHVDPEEGNLGKATEEEIAATVAQPHTYHGELALAADLVEDVAPRKSYWWIFMVAVLAVLAAENSLARRFGHYTSRVPTAGSRPS